MLGDIDDSGFRPVVDTVWHNDTRAPGVKHSGDNRTGEGEGDDEVSASSFAAWRSPPHLLSSSCAWSSHAA